jgi:phosphatidylinositol alpha 1,6-mannosyltransferase
MDTRAPRVALFTDSYYEANGVARTASNLEAFAARNERPLLLVHGGRTTQVVESGSVVRLELARARFTSFNLEHDLQYDVTLWRHLAKVSSVLRWFRPDVVHYTGPSDVGQLGLLLGRRTGAALVGSWHTNVHEYAALRLAPYLRFLGEDARARVGATVERRTLDVALSFYRAPRVILAPNQHWMQVARERLRKPAFLMTRGVDTDAFSPIRRRRTDGTLNIGYVGRLSAEKNVRALAALEHSLLEAGAPPFRITVVGDGGEREWLREHLRHGALTGTLRGDALAEAYAGFDLFAFPSETETVGNVVLEAMASGVPVVAMAAGGPKYIAAGSAGAALARTRDEWLDLCRRIALDADLRQTMARTLLGRGLPDCVRRLRRRSAVARGFAGDGG